LGSKREFQPYFFFFFVRFSGSDVKSRVTGSGQCYRYLRRGTGGGGGGGEQPAMTTTGCFFSAEHQHNLLHKSGEYHHHLPLLLLLLLLLYNLIYKLMILRVSGDCVWNLRGGRNVNRRVPEAKEHMCLWRKKGQFHLHSIERTPVPEAKERCVFGERGTSPSPERSPVQEAKGRCVFGERTTFPSPFTRRTPLPLDYVVGWKSMAQQNLLM
jgi:hypothetical protein